MSKSKFIFSTFLALIFAVVLDGTFNQVTAARGGGHEGGYYLPEPEVLAFPRYPYKAKVGQNVVCPNGMIGRVKEVKKNGIASVAVAVSRILPKSSRYFGEPSDFFIRDLRRATRKDLKIWREEGRSLAHLPDELRPGEAQERENNRRWALEARMEEERQDAIKFAHEVAPIILEDH